MWVAIPYPFDASGEIDEAETRRNVRYYVDQIKVDGFDITINQQDDAVNGQHSPQQGAANMKTLADNAQVVFVVGPYNSSVAAAEIPVGNAAGLALKNTLSARVRNGTISSPHAPQPPSLFFPRNMRGRPTTPTAGSRWTITPRTRSSKMRSWPSRSTPALTT